MPLWLEELELELIAAAPPDFAATARDCRCPICVDNARRGVPRITLGPDGRPVELPPLEPPPMIAVTIRGTASTWPELAPGPQTVEVPEGCTVVDLLGFLQYRNDELLRGFGPGALRAKLAGEDCDPFRELHDGDELRILGARTPIWRDLAHASRPRRASSN